MFFASFFTTFCSIFFKFFFGKRGLNVKKCIFVENKPETLTNRTDNPIMEKELAQAFSEMMKDYKPSEYVTREWPMKDGMYQQYSAYESDVQCTSGTHTSTVMY